MVISIPPKLWPWSCNAVTWETLAHQLSILRHKGNNANFKHCNSQLTHKRESNFDLSKRYYFLLSIFAEKIFFVSLSLAVPICVLPSLVLSFPFFFVCFTNAQQLPPLLTRWLHIIQVNIILHARCTYVQKMRYVFLFDIPT